MATAVTTSLLSVGWAQRVAAAALPSVSVGSNAVVEGDGGNRAMQFVVSLSGAATGPVSVRFATSDVSATGVAKARGGDYVSRSGALVFKAGQRSKTVSITVLGDTAIEGAEAFELRLSTLTGPAVMGSSTGIGTILDDDPASGLRISIGDATVTEADIGTTTARVTVSLSSAAPGPLTLQFATSPGSATGVASAATSGGDYLTKVAPVSFPAGARAKVVPITILSGSVPEPTETFTVSIAGSPFIARASGTVTILDNDSPGPAPSPLPSFSMIGYGENRFGEAGCGAPIYEVSPGQVGNDEDWFRVSASIGTDRVDAIKVDGTLWTWDRAATEPRQVGTDSDWVSVATGGWIGSGTGFSVATKRDGSLWSWGTDDSGELGDGGTVFNSADGVSTIPARVGTGRWRSVSVGMSTVMAIRDDGTLWGWGANDAGQLGLPGRISRDVPTRIGSGSNWAQVGVSADSSFAVTTTGELWSTGGDSGSFSRLGTAANWVAAQGYFGVKADGSLWRPVGTGEGQRIGAFNDWIDIESGMGWGFGRRADHSLWAMNTPRVNEVYGGFGETGTGRIYGGSLTDPVQVGDTADWAAVTTGFTFSFGIKDDGTLWSWGDNRWGQLRQGDASGSRDGDGGTGDDLRGCSFGGGWSSVATGTDHTVAVRDDGTLWAWGLNNYGQLGTDSTRAEYTPVRVGAQSDWRSVAVAGGATAAIKTDGSLWLWGLSPTYESVLTPQQLGADKRWSQVAVGSGAMGRTGRTRSGDRSPFELASANGVYLVAVAEDGTLWGLGENWYWQLGLGPGAPNAITSLTRITNSTGWRTVAAGTAGVTAIKVDGSLWWWGGVEDVETSGGPAVRTPQRWGTDSNWVSVSSGTGHAIAIDASGQVVGWGYRGGWRRMCDGYGVCRWLQASPPGTGELGPRSQVPGQIFDTSPWPIGYARLGAAGETSTVLVTGIVSSMPSGLVPPGVPSNVNGIGMSHVVYLLTD